MIDKRVVIVTGASRGIGKATAIALAADGFAVIVNYKSSAAAAQDVVQQIIDKGGDAHAVCADVSITEKRHSLVDATLNRFGRLDALVNNAGISPEPRLDILETTEESYDNVLNTNLKSVYFMTQAAANAMINLRRSSTIDSGVIVNISSIRYYTAAPNYGEYCVSKAGVHMITTLFADRLAEHGIYVYEIAPGIIETDMTSSDYVRNHYDKKLETGLSPLNRWGQPEEVARAVTAAARGDLSYCTGQTLHIDGGWHLRSL